MKTNFERYVIVCLFEGEVLEFHEHLTKDVCNLFKVKRQKLPAHFTIKAPFEHNDISELEKITEKFCNSHHSFPVILNNYNSFRNSVVFMDLTLSEKAKQTHDEYIEALQEIKWLQWKNNEGVHRVFHCTVVSKLASNKFNDVWNYVINHPYIFHCYFDNISILKWNGDSWITYRKFPLLKENQSFIT